METRLKRNETKKIGARITKKSNTRQRTIQKKKRTERKTARWTKKKIFIFIIFILFLKKIK